jgi:hypothetical protein
MLLLAEQHAPQQVLWHPTTPPDGWQADDAATSAAPALIALANRIVQAGAPSPLQ